MHYQPPTKIQIIPIAVYAIADRLYWALVTLIDVSLWLMNTTRQFMATDAHAIALNAFAHIHEPLPEFPALCPAAAPLALPSIAPAPVFPPPVVQWVSVHEALNDTAPTLTLCPSVVPMAFSQFLNPDHSIRSWLTPALPLVLAPFFAEAEAEAEAVPVSLAVLPVVPSVTKAAPVVKRTRKPKNTEETAQDKNPRKRSPKTTTAAAQ